MQLSMQGQKILKFVHIFTACCWLGGNFALLSLTYYKYGITDSSILLGVSMAAMWVDIVVVIILGALGCLITGLLYSLLTPWGFMKHRWVIVKWVLTVAMILYGTFFLGPWKSEMLAIHKESLDAVFESARYAHLHWLHTVGSPFQALGLLFLTYISVAKPWRKKEKMG